MSMAHQFLDFCRSKPADEKYNYFDPCGCAFAQFVIARGIASNPDVGGSFWTDDSGADHSIPDKLIRPLADDRECFGALVERLEHAFTTPSEGGEG